MYIIWDIVIELSDGRTIVFQLHHIYDYEYVQLQYTIAQSEYATHNAIRSNQVRCL